MSVLKSFLRSFNGVLMKLQDKSALEALINNVPTDVSGKWVKKEDLKFFALDVADYILTKIEKNLSDPNFQTNRN